MSAHPNNTPEQKQAWRDMRGKEFLSSEFLTVTAAKNYTPCSKTMSTRDRHRSLVQYRKSTVPFGRSWRTAIEFTHSANP